MVFILERHIHWFCIKFWIASRLPLSLGAGASRAKGVICVPLDTTVLVGNGSADRPPRRFGILAWIETDIGQIERSNLVFAHALMMDTLLV